MSTLNENPNPRKPLSELSRLALAYYDEKLKPILEPDQNNKFVAIHVDSGDYEVGKTSGEAARAILERRPIDGRLVVRKIGPEPEFGLTAHILAGEMQEAYRKSLEEPNIDVDHSEDHLSPLTRQALAIYRERLQAVLEPEQSGRGLAIHPESGDYEVASDPTQAGHLLRKRHPDGAFVKMTIGPEPDYELARRFLAGQQSASWGKIFPEERSMSTVFNKPANPQEQLPELSRLGLEYYDEKLKTVLEPTQNNHFVAIHVDSGDYQVAKTADDAVEAILERHPIDGRVVVRKIGPEPEYGLAARAAVGKA